MRANVFLLIWVMVLAFNSNAQIKLLSNGNVGIGTTSPQYKLDVNGYARFIAGNFSGTNSGITISDYYGNVVIDPLTDGYGMLGNVRKWGQAHINSIYTAIPITVSDEKIKENIRPITGALQIISKLNSVQYDLKKDYFDDKDLKGKTKMSSTLPIKNRIGFIAQEVQQVLPEIVVYDSIQQIHGIIYENLIPVLTQAIQEQQAEIKELKDNLAYFEQNCCSTNLKSAPISPGANNSAEIDQARLDQNIPNPFTQETNISCQIPRSANTSVLYIYNMNGTQLQQYSITGKGKQTVTIFGNTLEPGMYLYALVIDGKEVDTKRMILTK